MSIQVNSIAVSIDGTQSEQFHIEIKGSKFTFDNFMLEQKLLQPCKLTFSLQKDRQEDINDVQFNVCGAIIGAPVTLMMKTGNTEKNITNFQEGSQNDNIEFEGFIVNAQGFRESSDYSIQVTALSNDAKMFTHPSCYMFNDYKLNDIVTEIIQTEYNLSMEGKTEHSSTIHYTVQYNEGDYQFLQRLAIRYGEWMFSTGKKIHFGKLENQEEIQLKYPSQDMSEYNVKLQTTHIDYGYINSLYNTRAALSMGFGKHQDKTGNSLNDSTWDSSLQCYPRTTRRVTRGPGLESDDEATKFKKQEGEDMTLHVEPTFAEQRRIRSNMVKYSGTTFCSRIKIGAKLTIKDNYISGESSKKSEVEQDVILITSVTHNFDVNGEYQNNFQGIPATIDYPPYTDQNIFPVCDHPVRAIVIETDDPKQWGRVRVRFPWQLREYFGKHGDKEKNGMTPWIHVTQPYNGANEKEGGFYGVHLIPEQYTVVLVDFEEGNFERPYVCSCFFDPDYHVDSKWYPGFNNVKAIRTASGHTIEIHDSQTAESTGKSGYIRIYDNKSNHYELLLSTDRSLIKLRSSGNIELKASKDIIMEAGRDIKMKAKHDMVIDVDNDMTTGVGKDWSTMVTNDAFMQVTNEMTQTSDGNMKIATEKEMEFSSEEDMVIATKKKQYVNVDEDQVVKVQKDSKISANNFNVQAQQNVKLKGMNSSYLSDQKAKMQGMNVEVNASASAKIAASASLDLNAPIIKES